MVGGNLAARLSAARHCQLHLCYSAEDDLNGGAPVSTLATDLAAAPVPLVLVETFAGAAAEERRVIDEVLHAEGARHLLSRPASGSGWELVEGDSVERLDVYRLASWEDVERCAASASLRKAVKAFDDAGGCARAVAFEAVG